MSLNKIHHVKADKGFKVLDLIIYAAVIAVIVALFCVVFFVAKGNPLTGINVLYKNENVYSYDFEKDEQVVFMPEKILVEQNTDEEIVLRFYLSEDLSDYNLIQINKTERFVVVLEADCSTRKDCVYMEKITDTSGVIMCTPHALKIQPFAYDPGLGDGTIIM